MLPLRASYFNALAPISSTGVAACQVIDCAGYEFLTLVVGLGVITTNPVVALKLQESDVKATATTLTGGVDITGCVAGTSLNTDGGTSALPGTTDGGKVVLFEVDLRGRKRYILPVITAGAGGALLSAMAILSRAEQAPGTMAQKGVVQGFAA